MTTTEIFTRLLASHETWKENGLPLYAYRTFKKQLNPKHSAMARMLRRAGFREKTPFSWVKKGKVYKEATWERDAPPFITS